MRSLTNSTSYLTEVPNMTKMLYRVNEAAEACSIGRTKLYELVNRGALRTVRIDGAVRIPVSSVEEFIRGLQGQVSDTSRS